MKLLLDACVLYPTVMREMLLGTARAGLFEPLWSDRILEEWARAAGKLSAEDEVFARGEISLLKGQFPHSNVRPSENLQRRLWLPDLGDIHVLAAAIAGSADAIITLNRKDFPRHILREEGLDRLDADELLLKSYAISADIVTQVATGVLHQANALSQTSWTFRSLMKKARLPRLGKRLELDHQQ